MANVTGINAIDSLIHSSWAAFTYTPVALTYSFISAAADTPRAKDAVGFATMTAGQQAATKAALASWAAVANITFTEVSAGGDIRIGTNDQGNVSGGYAFYPNGGQATYVFTNNTGAYNFKFAEGDYGREVLLHELGHTLGLKHPGDYEKSNGGPGELPYLPAATDNKDFTLMSYNSGASHALNGNNDSSPMLYDIQAIQRLYGANMSYHTGADTYSFGQEAAPQCIWDAGGVDTLDFSLCKTATVINMNAGSFSSTVFGYNNISIAYGVTIERAIAGSGGSTIYDNAADNVITGGIRADKIYLGAGNDTVTGGGGDDTVVYAGSVGEYGFSGNTTKLTVTGEGRDVLSNITTLAFDDVEIRLSAFIALTGGGSADDAYRAGTGSELFSGGAGFDTVSYSRGRDNFIISALGYADLYEVSDNGGPGGRDLVSGIERLRFSDGTGVALDIDGAAGQTYRMYQAAFDRTPDARGIGYWLDKMDKGLSLVAMAQFFLDSAESKATFGAINDAQFVNLMYANVLHRAPDAAGLDFYVKGFAAHDFDRAAVLESFSESVENQAAVIGAITNGINYTVF